ncbi:mus308/POLQ like SFII DNA helicase [Cryptosporidium ryanae]|uniref:mus308/POLQ like SFII DNA helicase n=1 Tax=Cryptosporidium ryanae TaxID=515981 RepID=UPI00351A174D|nr:mus308/POLQ like SFII DNA helicase [Cryptosporidium ryanae]
MESISDTEMTSLDLSLKAELDMYMNETSEHKEMKDSNNCELDEDLIDEIENGKLMADELKAMEFEQNEVELANGSNVFAVKEIKENSIHNIGLDDRLVNYYCNKGLESLYEWQYECITRPGVLAGRNLVYSAPTSGGKTLVSELLMYKRVLETKRGALVVFPFVSLVSEKRESYYKVGGDICGLKVCEFHHASKNPLFEMYDIGVATIEKANSIINYYIEHGYLFKRLSVIVVDELHLLGDDQRGYILEVMLTKVRLLSKLFAESNGNSIQIIGMSATLPNLVDIGNWLDAVVYQSNYRPVPLREHIVLDGKAYLKPENNGQNHYGGDLCMSENTKASIASKNKDESFGFPSRWDVKELYLKCDVREFDEESLGLNKWKYPQVNMKDLLILGWDSLKRGESVLVFCPTKYSVETTALFYARCLRKPFYEGLTLEDVEKCAGPYRREAEARMNQIERMRMRLADEIIHSNSSKRSKYNKSLIECVKRGIGYHHSGLSNSERKIIEKGYRSGILSLLTATSTLAAGVNLPSKRVIFRGINIGKAFLTCVDYKQMSGRAGRVGQKNPYGESFILVNNTESKFHTDACVAGDRDQVKAAIKLLISDMLPLKSTFHTNINGLTRLILEILAVIRENADFVRYVEESELGAARSSILDLVMDSTLMSHQKEFQNGSPGVANRARDSSNLLKKALECLIDSGMVAKRGAIGVRDMHVYMLVGKDYILDHLCTHLGRSTVSSGLSPSMGYDLNNELCENMANALPSDLTYMAFQATPIPNKAFEDTETEIAEDCQRQDKQVSSSANSFPAQLQAYYRIDWEDLYNLIKNMGIIERQSIIKLGFDLEVISLASRVGGGCLPPSLRNNASMLGRYQRLYASSILKLLFLGVPAEEIISKYKSLNLRDIQKLYTNSLTFCVSCTVFTQCMGYWSLNLVFQNCLKRIQSVVLYDEYYFSSLFSRESVFNVDKDVRKLTGGFSGFSNISAIEARSSPFCIKTPNQLLVVPRKSIAYLINNRVYSGSAHTLQFVSQYVDQIFKEQLDRGKRVPLYNKSGSLFNINYLSDSNGAYKDAPGACSENHDDSNVKAKTASDSQMFEEKLLSVLNTSQECQGLLFPINDFSAAEEPEFDSKIDDDLSQLLLSALRRDEEPDVSNVLDELREAVEAENTDWEERQLPWPMLVPPQTCSKDNQSEFGYLNL